MEAGSEDIYQEAHQQLDRLLLPLVLGSTDGNKLQAARLLGITRKTLRLRLRELGLSDLMSAEGDEDDAIAPEDPLRPVRAQLVTATPASRAGSHASGRPARRPSNRVGPRSPGRPAAGEILSDDTARTGTGPIQSKSYHTR